MEGEGNVALVENKGNSLKSLVEENVGKKHVGRPKRRLEGNIELHFK